MKEHFRKTQKEMKLADFIRHSLTAGVHDIRETIKELKDMERDLMTQSKELDNFSDEQLRTLFAGELIENFDKLADRSAKQLDQELNDVDGQ